MLRGLDDPEPEPALTFVILLAKTGKPGQIYFSVMATLAAFAALSGVIFDPVQAAIGLHRRRLHKLLDHLQRDLTLSTQSSFRPKDQFVARVLDAFDMVRLGLL